MREERELGLWSYPNFVRYLRAIVVRMTPEPHKTVQPVLAIAEEVLASSLPRALGARYKTQLPRREGCGRAARVAANAIVEVLDAWSDSVSAYAQQLQAAQLQAERAALMRMGTGSQIQPVTDAPVVERSYHSACDVVRTVERYLLQSRHLTLDDLKVCSLSAHDDAREDVVHRDAALAAIDAGHWRLAHEILTRKG
jgi:hypothetical protein